MHLPFARPLWLLATSCLLAAPGLAAAQGKLPPELLEQLKKMQNPQLDPSAGGPMKGWTCRDLEDGKRMHVVDTTGKRSMNGVPSSEAGVRDTATPVAGLPACGLPR